MTDFGLSPLLGAIQIIESVFLTKTLEFEVPVWKPRPHNKGRTHKYYRTIPDPQVYMMGNQAFCHPVTARNLLEKLAEKRKPEFRQLEQIPTDRDFQIFSDAITRMIWSAFWIPPEYMENIKWKTE